jgi:NAD(P)-dependent dehydrogenase (short-subunit alcohol dehydrogenase family)
VIANAGVMRTPFGHTADGFETQFGTNHLGHFVLVNRIASLIAPGGRLVNVSSSGHRYADVGQALCPRSAARQSALSQERGDGGRMFLTTRPTVEGRTDTCPGETGSSLP